jgi:hypothetical protein
MEWGKLEMEKREVFDIVAAFCDFVGMQIKFASSARGVGR